MRNDPGRRFSRWASRGASLLVLALAAVARGTDPTPTPVSTPAPAGVGLKEALASLQAGDAPGAIRILEGLTIREPANTEAWRLLGVAYLRRKELDAAQAAF